MSEEIDADGARFLSPLANDPRSVSELVGAALNAADEEAWDAVGALHWRGTREVLDQALALCRSDRAAVRARGADILGQLGIPDRTFPDEGFAALIPLLSDNDRRVIFSVVLALQHLDRERALSHVLPFRRHEDADIRYAVAVALGSVDRQEAIDGLLELMGDADAEVRNWATFGLGQQSEADSEVIRLALAARLDDNDSDVRYEAICGLGRRADRRAVPFLKTMLHDDPDDVFAREAAARLAGLGSSNEVPTKELLGALQRRQRWNQSGSVEQRQLPCKRWPYGRQRRGRRHRRVSR